MYIFKEILVSHSHVEMSQVIDEGIRPPGVPPLRSWAGSWDCLNPVWPGYPWGRWTRGGGPLWGPPCRPPTRRHTTAGQRQSQAAGGQGLQIGEDILQGFVNTHYTYCLAEHLAESQVTQLYFGSSHSCGKDLLGSQTIQKYASQLGIWICHQYIQLVWLKSTHPKPIIPDLKLVWAWYFFNLLFTHTAQRRHRVKNGASLTLRDIKFWA